MTSYNPNSKIPRFNPQSDLQRKGRPMLEYQLSQQRMQNALSSDAPRIYLNGFGITATLGDIMILLEANGKPVGVLNMSYTVATTLAASAERAAAWHRELFDLVQSRREFRLLVPLKLTLR